MVKTLFIFGGGLDRAELEKQIENKTSPSTNFLGFYELRKDPRIQADYIQIKKNLYTVAGGLIRKYIVLDTLYLWFKLHKKINQYEVVVLASSAYLNLLFLKRLGFFRHQKWIALDLDFTIRYQKYAKNFISKTIFLTTIKQADSIICLSEVQKKHLLSVGVPEKILVFIPLGVDTNFLTPLQPANDFILTVGNDLGRDLKTFIEAMRLLPEYKAVIHCSPKNLEGLLDKVPTNITILTDKTYLDIKALYEKANSFVIAMKPDKYLIGSDCSGQTAILDSMAYGRAVISTHSPWLDDYFEERKQIMTVPPEDPVALARSIKELLTNPSLENILVKEARTLIDSSYNSEAMARKMVDIIVKL